MKSIKSLLIALTLVFTSFAYATNSKPTDKRVKSEVSQEIQKLLKNPSFLVEKDIKVTVRLTVNKKNEIVVLSVNSNANTYEVEGFIKSRLNYKKLSKKIDAKIYTLPVKMVSTI
ncbi:hypothetical protein [uncultured Tenacibaculum sp.]|uniref:hypothetical protein n=1 Tax=uncultured Tenacibaculum sp. TaxID=174713 RepID=UPI00261A9DF9|nr:hypothetical protein [uncultured Tenacibaculum sp.]